MKQQSHKHHYVPEWYQKLFSKNGSLDYLDTKYSYDSKKSLHCYRKTQPARCFCEKDLYMLKFGEYEDDSIERYLFGEIDNKGKIAVDNILGSKGEDGFTPPCYYQDLLIYMDAQLARTPRTLKLWNALDKNYVLMQMQKIRQLHLTMWFDSAWEIITAADDMEFIFSDNPVTFYNRKVFPGSKLGKSIMGPNFEWLGTQTLFPLSAKKLLVLTHMQFARNPGYNPCICRTNPRYFATSMFNAMDVIDYRVLTREDTLKVNFIIKSRADRFIAASSADFLYPEKNMKHTHWSKIAKNEFLIPDPRDIYIASGMYATFKDQPGISLNEYGMRQDNEYSIELREKESKILRERQKKKYERYGPSGRKPFR